MDILPIGNLSANFGAISVSLLYHCQLRSTHQLSNPWVLLRSYFKPVPNLWIRYSTNLFSGMVIIEMLIGLHSPYETMTAADNCSAYGSSR